MKKIALFLALLFSLNVEAYQYVDSEAGVQVEFPDWPESGSVQTERSGNDTIFEWSAPGKTTHMYCGVDGERYPVYRVAIHKLSAQEKLGSDYAALEAFSYQVYEDFGHDFVNSSWESREGYGYVYHYTYKEGDKTLHNTAFVVKGKRIVPTSQRSGQDRQVGCGTIHFTYPDHGGFVSSLKLKS